MQVVNNMYHSAQNYYQDIPTNTPKQMIYAAGAAFVLRTITSGSLHQAAVAAGLSALATAIHGLITPIFKSLTGKTQLTWGEEMCRTFIAIISAGAIAKAYGDNTILSNLTGLALLYGFLTYAHPQRRDLNTTDWLPIFPKFVPAN